MNHRCSELRQTHRTLDRLLLAFIRGCSIIRFQIIQRAKLAFRNRSNWREIIPRNIDHHRSRKTVHRDRCWSPLGTSLNTVSAIFGIIPEPEIPSILGTLPSLLPLFPIPNLVLRSKHIGCRNLDLLSLRPPSEVQTSDHAPKRTVHSPPTSRYSASTIPGK